jgi:hypothetical protein
MSRRETIPGRRPQGAAAPPRPHWCTPGFGAPVQRHQARCRRRGLRGLPEGSDRAGNAAPGRVRDDFAASVFRDVKAASAAHVELPGGLKIVARQVDAAGKVIDFGLRDAAGSLAKLEVKAWTAERWASELAARRKPKKALAHLVDQLKAAKSTEQPVYLAVSDAIKEDIVPLRAFLRGRDLGDVKVVTFAESKLKEVSNTLRKGAWTHSRGRDCGC